MFPDMPWMVGDDGIVGRSAHRRGAGLRRFGARAAVDCSPSAIDAMRIASSLQRGAPINPQGLTGTLSIDAQGRVRRELEWVRIKGGAPDAAGTADRGDRGDAVEPTSASAPAGMDRRQTGSLAENSACAFLESQGFTIVARNFLRRVGELDVVARAGDLLVDRRSPHARQRAVRRRGGQHRPRQAAPHRRHRRACSCSVTASCAIAACVST